MASAVSKAGGLGSLACAMLDAAALRGLLFAEKKECQNPLNVNFFTNIQPDSGEVADSAWLDCLSSYYNEFSAQPPREHPLDRRFRKALFTLAREAADVEDLRARFDAFIEDVRTSPPGDRPYSDEVRDILRGLSLRLDLTLQLQRRYDQARVGLGRQPA